jgi:hypothetical protein
VNARLVLAGLLGDTPFKSVVGLNAVLLNVKCCFGEACVDSAFDLGTSSISVFACEVPLDVAQLVHINFSKPPALIILSTQFGSPLPLQSTLKAFPIAE